MNSYVYSLILDAKQGDLKALEQIYIKYKDKVYALALTTTKSANEAEEATCLTFMQICDQIGTLADLNTFDVWLQYIALNESNAFHRGNSHPAEREASDRYEQRIEDDFFLPQDYIERFDLSYRLRMIIDSLPKIRRQTLLLSLYDKLTPAEIAQIMGCTEDQVCSRIRCTKGHIKTEIEDREHETGERVSGAALVPFDNVYSFLIHSRVMSAETAARIWKDIRAYAESKNNKTTGTKKMPVGIKAAIVAAITIIAVCAGILALLLAGPTFSSHKAVASDAAETTAATESATQEPATSVASATDAPAEKTPVAPDPEPAPEENAARQAEEQTAPASDNDGALLSAMAGTYYVPQLAGYTHSTLEIENGTVTQSVFSNGAEPYNKSESGEIDSVSAVGDTVIRYESSSGAAFSGTYYGADTPISQVPSSTIEYLSGFNRFDFSGSTLGITIIVDDQNICYVKNN